MSWPIQTTSLVNIDMTNFNFKPFFQTLLQSWGLSFLQIPSLTHDETYLRRLLEGPLHTEITLIPDLHAISLNKICNKYSIYNCYLGIQIEKMENEKEKINSLEEKSLPNCEIKWKYENLVTYAKFMQALSTKMILLIL